MRPQDHEKAHTAAAALDLSLSGYLAALVRRDELDQHGCPLWASTTEPDEPLTGLDLPKASAA